MVEDQWDFGDLDLDEVDPSKCEQNVYLSKAGAYHFQVEDVVSEANPQDRNGNDRFPSVKFFLTVLKSVEGQNRRGTKLIHELKLGAKGGNGAPKAWMIQSACKFFYALGLLQKDESGEKFVDEKGSTRINPGELIARAQGKQFIGKAFFDKGSTDEGTGKTYAPKVGLHFSNGCFQINDPKVLDVPVSEEDLSPEDRKARGSQSSESSEKKKSEFADI